MLVKYKFDVDLEWVIPSPLKIAHRCNSMMCSFILTHFHVAVSASYSNSLTLKVYFIDLNHHLGFQLQCFNASNFEFQIQMIVLHVLLDLNLEEIIRFHDLDCLLAHRICPFSALVLAQ